MRTVIFVGLLSIAFALIKNDEVLSDMAIWFYAIIFFISSVMDAWEFIKNISRD